MIISCYIPSYNSQATIIHVLDSLLSQSLPFSRIVIIDDCSNDHSPQLVKDFIGNHSAHNIQLVENKSNQGLSRIRNQILDMSHEDDFSVMVDSDVVLDALWLKDMVHFFERYDCIAACGNLQEKFKSSLPDKWKYYYMNQNFLHSSGHIGHVFGSNLILNRKKVSSYFRFPDVYMNNAEDIYFSNKMKSFGKLGYNANANAVHLKKFSSLLSVFRNYYHWTRHEKKNMSFFPSVHQNLLIINHLYHKKSPLYIKFLNTGVFPLFCIWDLLGRK